jgi:Lysylphosphatidylglycerol synthase TM region
VRSHGATRLAEPFRRLPTGKAAGSSRLPFRSLAGTALGIGFVAAAALLVRAQIAAAAGQLADEHGLPLLVAAMCAPLVPAATAGAWRSVLASRGISLTAAEAWGCYGLGSVANTFLPGRAGDVLRIELFSRRLSHGSCRWLACGVSTSVGLAQSTVFGVVIGAGSVLSALPIWAIVPSLALPTATWAAGRFALRRRPGERVACLATAATLSPLAWARVLGWVATAAAARLLLLVAMLEALQAPHPVAAAIVAACGLAVGNALPFAPGGAGVAAATMSVALGHSGLHASTAVAAAVSFHAFETAAGLLFGASGWLLLRLAERELPLAVGAS